MRPPLATWNPARCVWEKEQANLCGHSAPYSQTWPSSGMTLAGSAYALPTSAPLMSASASSSSPGQPETLPASTSSPHSPDDSLPRLPTLSVNAATRTRTEPRDVYHSNIDEWLALYIHGRLSDLLPTPAVLDKDFDATGTSKAREESGKQMHLAHVLGRDLLQTPSAAAGTGGQVRRGGDRADELLLGGQVKALLPTPNPFHSGNTESPEEWLERRADVEARTGTRHGPALPVVAWSITDGHPLSQDGDGPRLHEPEVKRLPTPDAYQGKRGGSQDPEKRRAGKHAVSLADVGEKGLNTVQMLPTPKATNNENRPSEGFGTGGVGYAIAHTDWAQYGPAIRIWENVLGRPAPPPTIAGKRGEPRLNPALTEWMMGLPEGHITSVPGLSREAQLKAAGNGVVPQQAAAALLLMIVDLVPLVETYAAEEGEGSAA